MRAAGSLPERADVSALAQILEVGSGGDSLEDLAQRVYSPMVLGVCENGQCAATWFRFLQQIQRVNRDQPLDHRLPIVVIGMMPSLVEDVGATEVGFRQFQWECCISSVDVEAFAMARIPESKASGVLKRVMARIVAEIAHSDVGLAAALCSLNPSDLVMPLEMLSSWHKPGDELLVWKDGTKSDHPSIVARRPHGREVIRGWVWEGQCAILLPWVERIRRRHISSLQPLLPERNDYGVGWREFEVGDIWWYLAETAPSSDAWTLFCILRDVRNKLAHLSPLNFNDMRNTISLVERLSNRLMPH
jgi:hypothetical protein